jgi:hypothetical protein
MAKLVCNYEEIGYTILQYSLDTKFIKELNAYPGKHVLGYVTCNNETNEYKFIYTESVATEASYHWSLDILKKFPYSEKEDSWIIFNCPPNKIARVFQHILSGESMHIEKWDIWSVEGKNDKVSVVTSWEIY